MIKLRNISKIYNEGKSNENRVLNDISLTVEEGEFVAVMGRSGVGKSTLLHIISLLDKPTSGDFILDEKNTASMNDTQCSKCRNENIGILLQDFRLIENETVMENVMAPLYFSKTPFRKMKNKAKEALFKVGISHLSKQAAYTLSGGEKQRVGLARAIVNSPNCLLADEPTGSLDTKTAGEIMQLLHNLNGDGMTIIIVTHDMDIANKCSKIVKIENGKLFE